MRRGSAASAFVRTGKGHAQASLDGPGSLAFTIFCC